MNREIPNTKNIVDLSNIESRDLMLELKSRGYYTDLIFGIGDVDWNLKSINDDRDEADHIKLDDSEKIDILDNCFNTDWYCERMNDNILDEILNRYDS